MWVRGRWGNVKVDYGRMWSWGMDEIRGWVGQWGVWG